MKLTPFFFIAIVFTSCLAGATNNSTVNETTSQTLLSNITDTTTSIDSDNETSSVSSSDSQLSAGAQMIQSGIESTIVDNVNGLLSGAGGLQLGDLNGSTEDSSEIAIFAITAHTIDPTNDTDMMEQIETMKDIYSNAILIFGAILALFLIFQQVNPEESAKLLETATGTYGYVAVADMAKYFINTCGWLLLGPGLFFGALKINNVLVEGQMLSVLDQVAFSSDSIGLYITFGVLWLVSLLFFALRLVMIVISANVWILYGLVFAFKKIRWAAILTTAYQIGFIFSQFVIVWTCCIVVSYTTSQELAWYSVTFVYLGLFLAVVVTELLFLIWPILWKVLSPKTFTTIIKLARYM